jgi:hypothetical protein
MPKDKEKLKEVVSKFEKFIKEVESIAPNSLFLKVSPDDFHRMVEKAIEESDEYLIKFTEEVNKILSEVKIDFDQKHLDIHKMYWETYVYYFLKYIKHLNVVKIPESTKKTPDFEIEFQNLRFSVEVKTLSVRDQNIKYKREQEDSLKAKIDAEEKGMGVAVYQPYYREGKSYDFSSTKQVIETLIDKINQNFKKGQFQKEYYKRILCVVLDQLPLLGTPQESSVPVYPCFHSKSCISGELWYVAFGKVGDLLFKPPEFEGKGNIDGRLTRNGVLIDNDVIDILMFVVPNFEKTEVVALYKDRSICNNFHSFEDFLYKVADYVNNELNENDYYYRLFENH